MNSSTQPSSSSSSSRRCPSVTGLALKVLDLWSVCVLYSTVCLTSASIPVQTARLRCGTDLLADLIFVCGDRGIYLGKHNWSGYGPRPRGKGIVDHCCMRGCDYQHLEMYCAPAQPRDRQQTTAGPTTSTLLPTTSTTSTSTTNSTNTTSTSTTSTTTTTTTTTTTQLSVTQQQFEAVFQKRLLQQLGAPDSPQRLAYRKKTQSNPQRRASRGSRKRTQGTTQEPSTSPHSTAPASPTPGTPRPS